MRQDERARTPADVPVPEMERLLSLALARGGDFADLYFEHQPHLLAAAGGGDHPHRLARA